MNMIWAGAHARPCDYGKRGRDELRRSAEVWNEVCIMGTGSFLVNTFFG
jgi:hypothetical protein